MEAGSVPGEHRASPRGEHPLSRCALSLLPSRDVGEADFNTLYGWPAGAMLSVPAGWPCGTSARLSPPGRVLCVRSGCCSVWRPHTFSSMSWRVLPPPRAALVPGLWGWHPAGSAELLTDLPVLGWSPPSAT